jgi:HEPN domain-containing protein
MKNKLSVEWRRKAEEDFSAAEVLSRSRSRRLFNAVCFHSQQAAEKYFKAYLSFNAVSFPKTHDLVLLEKICTKQDATFEFLADLVIVLNPYSVEFRYPGEQANSKDAKMAVKAVREIKNFVEGKLG